MIAYSQIIILLTPDRTWLWRLAEDEEEEQRTKRMITSQQQHENLL